MNLKYGLTRTVLLIGKYAIKFPRIRWGWKFFLMGFVANLQEKETYERFKDFYNIKLCPVLFGFAGIILIMRRVDKHVESFEEIEEYIKNNNTSIDLNFENFGYIDNELVLVDYATNLEYCYCKRCQEYIDIIMEKNKDNGYNNL
jgi:hypothetical protein